MAQYQLKLKGWSAIPVILVVLGFLGYRYFTIKTTLASEATDELRLRLQGEYASLLLQDLDPADLSRTGVDRRVQDLLDLEEIEFISVSSRGTDPVIVRVEIRVKGKTPPDGDTTRYYEMEHSMLTGWRVKREVGAFRYYTRLF